MSEKLGAVSDLNLAIRLRELMAQVDSGKPFWVWDDTRHWRASGQADRIMHCYVGTDEVGTVAIWLPLTVTNFNGFVLARFGLHRRSTAEQTFSGGYAEQAAEAKAWVEEQWRAGQ